MDESDVSEGQLILMSSLMSGLGWAEGEDTILGKKELLEQNGKCEFDTNQWDCAQAEISKYDKGLKMVIQTRAASLTPGSWRLNGINHCFSK